jgi:ABC-type phosphate transport system permease subunit
VSSLDFVQAARAIGANPVGVIVRHIIPGVIPAATVATTLAIGRGILLESTMSFFGVGVQPPTASWGNMLYQAQTAMTSEPWLAIFPGLFIFATWILVLGYPRSGLAAAMATSLMMLPIIVRSADVVLRLVPGNLREASAVPVVDAGDRRDASRSAAPRPGGPPDRGGRGGVRPPGARHPARRAEGQRPLCGRLRAFAMPPA